MECRELPWRRSAYQMRGLWRVAAARQPSATRLKRKTANCSPALNRARIVFDCRMANDPARLLFTDYSERFAVRVCSLQAVRSLSVGPQ
jgi:hypothetical protein